MWCHKQDPDHYLFHLGTAHLSLDSEPLLPFLMEKVAAVIPSKYEIVGLQLGLTLTQLQVIGSRHPTWVRHQRAFNDIFDVWRRRGSPPYTWRTLIAVLRSASVGEVLLSEELTSWITSNSDITGAMMSWNCQSKADSDIRSQTISHPLFGMLYSLSRDGPLGFQRMSQNKLESIAYYFQEVTHIAQELHL
ncbi:hypothetical protein EMCRGX_G004202 [Ephydatia muelleri]